MKEVVWEELGTTAQRRGHLSWVWRMSCLSARQKRAGDSKTHQAEGTACAKAEKRACSDPCNFGSFLLMSLGSASGLLGVALQYEQSNFTMSSLRHLVCSERALGIAAEVGERQGGSTRNQAHTNLVTSRARSTFPVVVLARRIVPFLPKHLPCLRMKCFCVYRC